MHVKPDEIYIVGKYGKRIVGLMRNEIMHGAIYGATGMGKSTLVATLAMNHVIHNETCVIIDPHGDLVDDVMTILPKWAWKRVILLDPLLALEMGRVVPIDWLYVPSRIYITPYGSALSSTLQLVIGITEAHAQMRTLLTEILTAMVEARFNGLKDLTLYDILMFFDDSVFRRKVLEYVDDSRRKFILNRINTQSAQSLRGRLNPLKNLKPFIGLPNGYSFDKLINEKNYIILAKGSKGLGESISKTFLNLVVSSIYYTGLARAKIPKPARRRTYVYADEAHNITVEEAIVGAYTELRKYRIFFTFITQYPTRIKNKEILDALKQAAQIFVFNPGEEKIDRVVPQQVEVEAKKLRKHYFFLIALFNGIKKWVRTPIETIPPFEYPTYDPDNINKVVDISFRRYGRETED